jgi:alkyldihydroxyacetonephosphate synthase
MGGDVKRERRAVHDLWPLGLLRTRAGETPPPVDVLVPESVDDVVEALRGGLSGDRRVVPAGGLSGVCGAVAPGPDDLVLDLTALTRIEIDEPNLMVRAQAGVNGLELERELNERGLTLGHYPASLPVASVGGLVSTRSSGQQSTRYGSVEDMVIGLTAVLPGGRLLTSRPHPRSALPALHQLFLGAEGGLGVIVEAVLRAHRLPELVVGRGWKLPSVESGLEAMRETIQRGLRPLVLRLYDPEDTLFQGLDEGCLLVGAAAGPEPLARAEAALLADLVRERGGEDLGEEPWRRWERHRFDLSADRLRDVLEPAGAFTDTVDVAAAWTDLPGLYGEVKAHLGAIGLAMCHFSHADGQGCCAYFTFAGHAASEDEARAAYEDAWRGAIEATLRRGGTIAHHHGVGQVRRPWVRQELGSWWQVWELVREALDPGGQMNPHALGGRMG